MNSKTAYLTLTCLALVITVFYFSSCENVEQNPSQQQFTETPVIVIHIGSKNGSVSKPSTNSSGAPVTQNPDRKLIVVPAKEKTDYSVALSTIKKVASNVVYINVFEYDENGSIINAFNCTGCVYTQMNSQTYIAIPSHCVGKSEREMTEIVFPSGKIISPKTTRLIYYNEVDAGFLIINESVPTTGIRSMITLQKPEVGDSIVICGAEPSEDGMKFFRKHAIVYNDFFDENMTLVAESSGMLSGSSGSALISNKGVIGINVATRIVDNQKEVYTPIEIFENLLKEEQ